MMRELRIICNKELRSAEFGDVRTFNDVRCCEVRFPDFSYVGAFVHLVKFNDVRVEDHLQTRIEICRDANVDSLYSCEPSACERWSCQVPLVPPFSVVLISRNHGAPQVV